MKIIVRQIHNYQLKVIRLIGLVALTLGVALSAQAQTQWWQTSYPKPFDSEQLTKKQSPIVVDGTRFVDNTGKEYVFKGVNIADPDKLSQQGQWNEALFKEVKRWGANTIRLPIHPIAWQNLGAQQYFEWLDQAVVWANKLDMYLIIDWHSIGNLPAGLFQHPMYTTSLSQTQSFWQQIAFRYKGVPTVAVYELFNEPTNNYIGNGNNSLGTVSWAQWKEQMESMIDLVRAYDEEVIPLVTGFNWAYDLSPIRLQPFERQNIAYAVHPYPQKAKPTKHKSAKVMREKFFDLWQKQWGFVADRAPMIATEIGWANKDEHGAHVPTINNDKTYGPNIVDFLAERNISWTVWAFDPEWAPTMIKSWDFEPTEQGEFFKEVFQGNYKSKY